MESIGILRVVRAFNLPKTERTSKIDAYISVIQNGSVIGKTKVQDDNEEPVWEQSFTVKVGRDATGRLGGSIILQLFDENTFKDKLVGHVNFDFSAMTPDQMKYVELPFIFEEDKFTKQGRNSRVAVSFHPGILSYASMRNMWAAAPGVICNDQQQRLFIPLQDPNAGPLILGIEYEQGGMVDFKIFVTAPGNTTHIDLFLGGRPKTKIRRRLFPQGETIAPGLTAFQEIKMDDVPADTDFNALTVIAHDASYLGGTNAAEVVRAHGWAGALNFEKACRTLNNIDVDKKEEEIFMMVDPNETVLIIDWDKDDVDIKLAILTTPTTSDKAYDLTISGQKCKVTSEIFTPAKIKIDGKYHVGRIVELDDVAYGSSLKAIEIHRLQLTRMRTYSIQGLTRIMG